MKGNIQVESEENHGSTFTVTIPFQFTTNKPSDSNLEGPTSLNLQLTGQQNYIKLLSTEKQFTTNTESKIIVAEDNPINRKVILSLLKKVGHIADSVCDGVELLERFDISQHRVVLTDMVSSYKYFNDLP